MNKLEKFHPKRTCPTWCVETEFQEKGGVIITAAIMPRLTLSSSRYHSPSGVCPTKSHPGRRFPDDSSIHKAVFDWKTLRASFYRLGALSGYDRVAADDEFVLVEAAHNSNNVAMNRAIIVFIVFLHRHQAAFRKISLPHWAAIRSSRLCHLSHHRNRRQY